MVSDPGTLVTPVVLTFNEGLNVGRTLESLRWASRVVVFDSGSTDATEQVARQFTNVEWHAHPFDTHGAQWERAIRGTGISTDYVLALDADMQVPRSFVEELKRRFLPDHFTGGLVAFDFMILGRLLSSSLCPAQLRLFRRDTVFLGQSGHKAVFQIEGPVYKFRARVIHDDRKVMDHWVQSQVRYSRLEAEKLEHCGGRGWKDRLRMLGLMPLIAGAGAYVRAGGPLRGAASLCYAWERMTYECLLAMRLMRKRKIDER